MQWKKKIQDPAYLMAMRRPTFIISRSIALTAGGILNAQPRWLFLDLVSTVTDLIKTRPQIPTVTLPSDLSETLSTVTGDSTVVTPPEPEQKKKKSGPKSPVNKAKKAIRRFFS